MNNNPKYNNCPPRMSDGRHFTDYRPNCMVNNLVQTQNNVPDTYQYRQFLTENASKLMDLNRLYAVQRNYCSTCDAPELENSKMKPLRNSS